MNTFATNSLRPYLFGLICLFFCHTLWAESFKSKEIKAQVILKHKCYTCHSNSPRYPFYSEWPGFKIFIQKKINKALNDFHFQRDSLRDNIERLRASIEQGDMPPYWYRFFHRTHQISEDEKIALLEYLDELPKQIAEQSQTRHSHIFEVIPQNHNCDPQKVALGKKLFHDPRLSQNNTISCARCHDLSLGGTDQLATSIGIHGQKGSMNSPTVFNSAYNFRQFWDGRAANLAEQASGPIHNPIEMGSNWPEVISKLSKDSEYLDMFKSIYGTTMISEHKIIDAIVNFERSLITPNSRFDQFLQGKTDALNAQEQKGYHLFIQLGCSSCHQGVNVGGQLYESFGIFGNYYEDRNQEIRSSDLGRYNQTNRKLDKFKFKVPSLRNIEHTFPYLHDGSIESLKEMIHIMARYQLGKSLEDHEIDQIEAFLKTLSGQYEGQSL